MASIPRRLQDDRLRFILVKPSSKFPVEEGWTVDKNYPHTSPVVASHLAMGGNYGVLCGVSKLVVIDADTALVSEAVKANLPETFTVLTGKMGSHFYYFVEGEIETTKLRDPADTDPSHDIGHIRAKGAQVVGPTSKHERGTLYQVLKDVPIATVKAEDMRFALRKYIDMDKTGDKGRDQEFSEGMSTGYGDLSSIRVDSIVNTTGFKKMSDGYSGAHPVHGSETGMNFHLNTDHNYWYCFRCNSGGGPISLVAVLEGIIRCDEAKRGGLRGDAFKRAVEAGIKKYGFPQTLSRSTTIASGTDSGIEEDTMPCEVADLVLQKYNIITAIEGDEMYIYRDGVYVPGAEVVIRDMVVQLAPEKSEHFGSEVCYQIRARTHRHESEFNANVDHICLQNGIYDLNTQTLLPFSPDELMTLKLPVTYVKDADCPAIKKFIAEVVRPDDAANIQELIGYTLYRKYNIQRAFMFTGSGANGKGVLLHLIERFLGRGCVSAVALQTLEANRFKAAELHHKLANIHADLSPHAMGSLGLFKMMTGEDLIEAETKFGPSFRFVNYAKMIFSANKVPWIGEDTDAVYRRWIIVDFPNKFEGERRDPELLKKLSTPEELSGLFNYAVEGLIRLLAKGEFSSTQTTDETRRMYQRLASPIKAYCDDVLLTDPNGWISKDDLYESLIRYCDKNKIPKPSKTLVGRELARHMPSVRDERKMTGGRRETGWCGVRFKTPEDDIDTMRPEEGLDKYAEEKYDYGAEDRGGWMETAGGGR